MLTVENIRTMVEALAAAGIVFEAGLSDDEVQRVQAAFGLAFPPDLRRFLQTALPVSPRFPNWRSGSVAQLREQIDFCFDGLYFDVEHNDLWLEEWGEPPATAEEALAMARRALAEVPRMIPVYAHRFLPAEPLEAGNPVFSIYQSDIIIYGADLAAYLSAEFSIPNPTASPQRPREIRFWSEWVV